MNSEFCFRLLEGQCPFEQTILYSRASLKLETKIETPVVREKERS